MIQKLEARQKVRRGRAPGAGPIPAPPWRRAVLPGAAFLAGLVSSLSTALGQTSFIGAGAAALAGPYALWVFAGALPGFLFGAGLEKGIIPLCSILVIAGLRAVDPFGPRREEPIYLGLMTAGVLLLFSCVMSAALSWDVYGVTVRMLGSLVCGGLTFAARTVYDNVRRRHRLRVTGLEGMLAAMVYMAAVSVLCSLRLGPFMPGRAAGVFIMLWAARKYRSLGGAALGAMTACGAMFCDPSLGATTLLLAAAGLICGAFSRLGTLAQTMSFLISLLVGLVSIGIGPDSYRLLFDGAAGAAAFAAIPSSAVNRLSRSLTAASFSKAGETAAAGLRFTGSTLGDLRRRLDLMTAAMDRGDLAITPEEEVERCVCRDCPSYELCFKVSDAEERLRALAGLTRDRGTCTSADAGLAVPFCARPELLSQAFSEFTSRLAEDRAESLRTRELRGLLAQQLGAMELMLQDLADRADGMLCPEPILTERLGELLAGEGWPDASCRVSTLNGELRAEAFIPGELHPDRERLSERVSSCLDCDMGLPDLTYEGGVTRLSFAELPGAWAESASFTASAPGGTCSGDSFDIFGTDGCKQYAVLSDGMGTGKRARLDSAFTVSLCKRLLCAGLAPATVQSLINSVLRVKGWEESFATLDLLTIDLSQGTARLMKSGAPTSRLVRDGSFVSLGGQAFPVGILETCAPDITDLKLFDGDLLLMTSDGVDEDTADQLGAMAAQRPDLDTEELVRRLGTYALDKLDSPTRDDLTILAVRFRGKK